MTPEQKYEKEKKEKAEEREANLVYFTRIVVALERIADALDRASPVLTRHPDGYSTDIR